MSESDEAQVSRRQLFADLASGLQRGILRATGLDGERDDRDEEPVPEDGDARLRREMERAEGHLAELQAFMATHQEDPDPDPDPGLDPEPDQEDPPPNRG